MQVQGKTKTIALIWALSSMFMCSVTNAADLTGISVISLGVVEGSAVLQFSDGKMAIVHIGDTVHGTSATVRQVLSDRLVIESLTATTPPRSEVAWIYKSQKGEKSKVQRLDSQGPPEPVEMVEVMQELKR